MLGRMWGMLKVAGDPVPYTGISGINVTSKNVFRSTGNPGESRSAVNVLGMIQSVARYLFLPFAAFGIYVAVRATIGASVVCCWSRCFTISFPARPRTQRFGMFCRCTAINVFASVGIVQLIRIIRG